MIKLVSWQFRVEIHLLEALAGTLPLYFSLLQLFPNPCAVFELWGLDKGTHNGE